MGKITDLVIGIIVLIVGIWILTRLGLNLPSIVSMFKHFFFSSSSPSTSNSTSAILLSMTVSNSKIRQKAFRRIESVKRSSIIKAIGIVTKFKRREK